jgi:outer membrane protein OmpA-like peptidoglycan-associated protein
MFESILGMVTPEMRHSIASRLGESPQSVQSGLSTATAATLGAMAHNSADSGFMDQMIQFASRASSSNILGSLGSIASNGASGASGDLVNRFQSLVFGSQQGRVEGLISQQAGLSASSGSSLLKMAAPLVMGYLAKQHGSGALNATSLGNTLRAEAPNLGNYVPAGFFRAGQQPQETLTRVTDTVSKVTATDQTSSQTSGYRPADSTYRATETRDTRTETPYRTSGGVESQPTPNHLRWAVPAAIVGALLLGWLLFRAMHSGVERPAREAANTALNPGTEVTPPAGRPTSPGAAPPMAAATPSPTENANPYAGLGEFTNVKLPDGTELNVPSRGVEARLVTYLQGSSNPASEITWFDFDRLLFDTNSSTLQPSSYEQLNNVAAILKAYPSAKIRLGGYTDNTGDVDANRKLSQERANSVMAELGKRGVDPSRLTATGYGEENPVADNSTEEGRQKNRRISIRVAEK